MDTIAACGAETHSYYAMFFLAIIILNSQRRSARAAFRWRCCTRLRPEGRPSSRPQHSLVLLATAHSAPTIQVSFSSTSPCLYRSPFRYSYCLSRLVCVGLLVARSFSALHSFTDELLCCAKGEIWELTRGSTT